MQTLYFDQLCLFGAEWGEDWDIYKGDPCANAARGEEDISPSGWGLRVRLRAVYGFADATISACAYKPQCCGISDRGLWIAWNKGRDPDVVG